MPFPGLNIDNLPFFAVIAATAEGKTLLHDWVYENRAIYLTELIKLGATSSCSTRTGCASRAPPTGRAPRSSARRPPPGRGDPAGHARRQGHVGPASMYVIYRGYEYLAERLNHLGAHIETFRDI